MEIWNHEAGSSTRRDEIMAGYLDRNIANLEAALKYSDLTPEQRAQAEKDLQEARANKGGWEDKALGGDPVPKPKEDPVEEMGVRGLGALGRGLDSWGYGNDDNTDLGKAWRNYRSEFSSMSPHKGMPLSAEDRQAYLAELLENDPASSLYDLSTVKDFSEEEDRWRKERMSKDVAGYYADDTAYVKDLDKLGTKAGLFKGGEFDKQLASVASHELTHPKVSKYGIDMNLQEPRGSGYGGEKYRGWDSDYLTLDREGKEVYMPHEKEELLTRMIEMQNFPKTSDAEWYFGESPYGISKHPSGAEGYEAGKILQSSLEPALQKYNQLVEAEKNPLIYDEETGYDARDLQNRGLAGIYPHAWDYGDQWQQPDQQEDSSALDKIKNYFKPAQIGASAIANKLGMGWAAGIPGLMFSGLTGGMGNLANTMRGGLTQRGYEQARNQRRTASRVENMLTRKAAGDPYSQKNLNVLTMGSRPGHYDVPGGNGGGGGGAQPGSMPTGTAGRNPWGRARGGLAGLWPRY